MTKYTLRLVYSSQSQPAMYDVSLSKTQEDHPESFFTESVRESIRGSLQMQSNRVVSDQHLKKILNIWLQDLKEGYPVTTVLLELPSLLESNILKIKDQGNQEIPVLIMPDASDIEPLWGALPPLNFS